MMKFRQLTNDSRGSTLIEIIVSVLIVGIAFVPLMLGLNTALNINKENEKELYAENVAANVVEVCKTYGTKGLAALVKNAEPETTPTADPDAPAPTDDPSASPTPTAVPSWDISVSEEISDIFSGEAVKIEKTGGTAKYPVYTISGIEAGTGKIYSAEITFDAGTDEKPLEIQNDFSGYPQIEGVSGAVFVNFGEDNLDTIVAAMIDPDKLASGMTQEKLAENAANWLKRTMVITVEPFSAVDATTGETKDKYRVKKEIVYSYPSDASGIRYLNGDPVFNPSDYNPSDYHSQAETIKEYDTLPPSYILTFKTLKYRGKNISLAFEKEGEDIKLANDNIKIIKSAPGEIYVYALCENGASLKDKSFSIRFTGEDSGGAATTETDPDEEEPDPEPTPAAAGYLIHAYSNLNKYCTAVEGMDTFGTGIPGKQSKMKNVTIVIRDKEGNAKVTKQSTVIETE